MQVKTTISIGVPFDWKLQMFLFDEGYTHVYNIGCTKDDYYADYGHPDNYYILPLPAGHLLLNEQHNPQIMEILSLDVFDMANEAVDHLNFIMNLPIDVYDKFTKS